MPSTTFPSTDRRGITLAAAFFLLLGLGASVTLGPQLSVWMSGPAWALLGVACIFAVPLGGKLPQAVWWTGVPLVAWLGWRAAVSPVAEMGVADGLLLASAVAVFAVTRGLLPRRGGIELLFTGLTILTVANGAVMLWQVSEPQGVLWLRRGTESFPSGFFGYYGDCAAFLLAVGLLAGGLVWDGRRAAWFRWMMAALLLVAVAGVVMSRSRGGIVGLGVGAGVLLFCGPWLTLPKGSKWRGVMALALPLVTVAGLLVIGSAITEAQEVRGVKGSVVGDDHARLFWWQLAVAGITTHPWVGGGSRSYGWESFSHWDGSWEKYSAAKPDFVHNEVLQLTHDYGLVGLALLVIFLGTIAVVGITGRWSGAEGKSGTAVWLGGCAATLGLLVHGCMHFVFHVPPAAWMLGMALAFALETTRRADAPRRGIAAGVLVTACAGALAFFSVPALRVFRELEPVAYEIRDARPSLGEAISRVQRAVAVWPLPSLYLDLGKLSHEAAAGAEGADQRILLEQAQAAVHQAAEKHPYDPEAAVNLANLLSALQRDEEAEAEFARAIHLQGGLEWGFRARYSAAAHHFRVAERHRAAGDTGAALASMLRARDFFDPFTAASAGDYGVEGRQFRIALAVHLGPRLESLARHEEAAAEYERAMKIPGSESIPYLAARNLKAWGDAIWLERRPGEALAKFEHAWNLCNLARNNGFTGYPASDIAELMRQITVKLEFLRGAGIRPVK